MTLREGVSQAKGFVASRPDWLIERFNNLATTNFLYLLVGYLSVRTSEHYMRTPDWTPSAEWLVFIAGLLGGSITQWVKKRTTDHNYQRIVQGNEPVPPQDASPEGSERAV